MKALSGTTSHRRENPHHRESQHRKPKVPKRKKVSSLRQTQRKKLMKMSTNLKSSLQSINLILKYRTSHRK
jgi:uncharacterized FlaG/YvyC family protein